MCTVRYGCSIHGSRVDQKEKEAISHVNYFLLLALLFRNNLYRWQEGGS